MMIFGMMCVAACDPAGSGTVRVGGVSQAPEAGRAGGAVWMRAPPRASNGCRYEGRRAAISRSRCTILDDTDADKETFGACGCAFSESTALGRGNDEAYRIA